jgi:hypothetical protein
MKRLSSIVLASAVLALGACGGDNNSSDNASTTAPTGATGPTTTQKTNTSTTTTGTRKKGKSGSGSKGKSGSGSSGGSTTNTQTTKTTKTTTTPAQTTPNQIPKPFNTARKVCGAFLPPQVVKPVERGKRSAASLARQYSRGWPKEQRRQAYAGCLQGLKDRQPKKKK